MKNLLIGLIIFFLGIFHFACDRTEPLDRPINDMFAFEMDGEVRNYSSDLSCTRFNDGSMLIESGSIKLYLESLNFDTVYLSQGNFSYATCNHELGSVYSSDAFPESNGYIKINEYDEVEQKISGAFEFKAFDHGDVNDVVELKNGIFYKVEVEDANEDFKPSRINAIFDSAPVKFINVFVNDDDLLELGRISFTSWHANENYISLRLSENLEIGVNMIAPNTSPSLVKFSLDRSVQNQLVRDMDYPKSDCQINLEIWDMDNKRVKGNLSGIWSNDSSNPDTYDEVNIEQFEFDVTWE